MIRTLLILGVLAAFVVLIARPAESSSANKPYKMFSPVYQIDPDTSLCFATATTYHAGSWRLAGIAHVPCSPQVMWQIEHGSRR